jgi:phosphatidylinositol glycan class B
MKPSRNNQKHLLNTIFFFQLFTTLCSWFNFHMAARTLSNSMEMVFTMLALNFWPFAQQRVGWLMRYRVALLLASIACIMRPTNGLIWLFLGLHLIITHRKRVLIALNAAVIGALVLAANAWLDTRLYRSSNWVFTPLTFFQINVVNSISLFYGVHTWHWYLTQGLPVIFTTMLPMIGYGLYSMSPATKERMRPLLMLVAWVVSIYSLLPHKEFRFLFPVVPVLLMVVAYGIQRLQTKWRKRVMWMLVLTQLPMALYLSLWHQRGVVDVMKWLRVQEGSVGVLMPCHSTPWFSIIHQPRSMWFLTCEPPLAADPAYQDEADRFYMDPIGFLKLEAPERIQKSKYLVLFDSLVPHLDGYLEAQGFKECQRFFNSHFHDDARRRGDVLVYCHL